MKEYDPNDAVEFIYNNAPKYAKAKGQLAELERTNIVLKQLR